MRARCRRRRRLPQVLLGRPGPGTGTDWVAGPPAESGAESVPAGTGQAAGMGVDQDTASDTAARTPQLGLAYMRADSAGARTAAHTVAGVGRHIRR